MITVFADYLPTRLVPVIGAKNSKPSRTPKNGRKFQLDTHHKIGFV